MDVQEPLQVRDRARDHFIVDKAGTVGDHHAKGIPLKRQLNPVSTSVIIEGKM